MFKLYSSVYLQNSTFLNKNAQFNFVISMEFHQTHFLNLVLSALKSKLLTAKNSERFDTRDKKKTPGQSKPQEDNKRKANICVKKVGKDFFTMEKFSGGYPTLYHRHIPQLLVKGDSIVLISLHDT